VIAGLLFAVVGRMVYERTHTRDLARLRGMTLYKTMPFAAVTFVIAGLASMGMPGFSGFPAELSILVGAWQASPAWALVAAIGVLVAAAFTLRAIHVSFFGDGNIEGPAPSATSDAGGRPGGRPSIPPDHPMAPITWPEKAGAFILLGATILIGLQPGLLLDWIIPALQSPFMQAAMTGGGR
jgi:NADH-quinone oxidoreductase subunit M